MVEPKKPVGSVDPDEPRVDVSAPVSVQEVELHMEPLPPVDVVSGAPTAGSRVIGRLAGVEVGIWEMTPGAVRDVEADEVFVVVSGSATIEFDDGREVVVRPGDVMALVQGQRTVWTVTEPLRKVYVTAPGAGHD